jgi:hypothetical protein
MKMAESQQINECLQRLKVVDTALEAIVVAYPDIDRSRYRQFTNAREEIARIIDILADVLGSFPQMKGA